MSRRAGGSVGPRVILLILAVVCFAFVAVGVDPLSGKLNLGATGLALFAASFMFP